MTQRPIKTLNARLKAFCLGTNRSIRLWATGLEKRRFMFAATWMSGNDSVATEYGPNPDAAIDAMLKRWEAREK